jgi:hypothetical protein
MGRGGSILLRQHDGDDALGDGRVGRIGRMHRQGRIEIIVEEQLVPFNFEHAEVMFLVWVIGVAEIVVDRDSLDDASDCFGAECGNTCRNKGVPALRFWRSSSLSVRMVSVLVVIVLS